MRISFYKITIRITLFFNKEYWILVMETKNCATVYPGMGGDVLIVTNSRKDKLLKRILQKKFFKVF